LRAKVGVERLDERVEVGQVAKLDGEQEPLVRPDRSRQRLDERVVLAARRGFLMGLRREVLLVAVRCA
jgi:hypothetical protein